MDQVATQTILPAQIAEIDFRDGLLDTQAISLIGVRHIEFLPN